jgi:hypothetical protein
VSTAFVQGLAMRAEERTAAARPLRWAASSCGRCCTPQFAERRNRPIRETWWGSTFQLAQECCLSWSETGMRLAKARTVANDKRLCIRQRSFPGSALSLVLVLLPLVGAIPLPVLVLLPLVAVALPPVAVALPPVVVILPRASAPAVLLRALGARFRSRMRCDQPLC